MFIISPPKTVSPEIPIPKRNNFFKNEYKTVDQIKKLILFEMCFGLNRQYLFSENKCVLFLSRAYSVMLIILSIICIVFIDLNSRLFNVLKDISGFEYILLSFSAVVLNKKKLKKFFVDLNFFDKILGVNEDISKLSVKYWTSIQLSNIILYHFINFIVIAHYKISSYSYSFIYLPFLIHDCEIIFYTNFLIFVLRRVNILKAHAAKIFVDDVAVYNDSNNISNRNTFSGNTNVNINSFYKAYNLLYKSSLNLNSIMGFPVFFLIHIVLILFFFH